MTTLLITVFPSILILFYFFLSDKFKEPKGTVILVFVLGILICFPAGILNSFMADNLETLTILMILRLVFLAQLGLKKF